MKNELKGTLRLFLSLFPAIKNGNQIFDGVPAEDPS